MPDLGEDEQRLVMKFWDQPGILFLECVVLFLGYLFSAGNEDMPWAGRAGFILALLIALWAWWRAFTRSRIISNTPAERIVSTAQGYARLAGHGQLLGGHQNVFEPGSGLPCLWRRVVYRRGDRNSRDSAETETDESDDSFLLDDGSGAVCAVDPEGAQMLVQRHRSFTEDGAYVEYWFLRPGDPVYVLGDFFTVGSADVDLDTHRQIGELLELWKADRPGLLRRFDLDHDGELSEQEWELARAAAQQEVKRTQQEALAAPEAHIVRKPRDGQPYLISDCSLDLIARRLWLWAMVHAAVFVLAAAALAWFHAHGGGRQDPATAKAEALF